MLVASSSPFGTTGLMLLKLREVPTVLEFGGFIDRATCPLFAAL